MSRAGLPWLLLLAAAPLAPTAEPPPQVDWTPHADALLPLDLAFHDEQGRAVALRQYFDHGPVVLAFSYFTCRGLCPLVLQGLGEVTTDVPATALAISIDPRDGPAAARMRRAEIRHDGAAPLHLLTDAGGTAAATLARAAGFHYQYDAALDQYAHPAGIVVVAPDGRIRGYLYGVQFDAAQLRALLVDAPRAAAAAPPLLLLCFHYDPHTGRYTLSILRVLQLAGVAVVATLALLIWRTRRAARA